MSLREGISKLRGQVDKILDKMESKSAPPLPHASKPIQSVGQSQTAPHHLQQYGEFAVFPPVPTSSKPNSLAAPVSYISPGVTYWNPIFAPHIPVTDYFDYNLGAGGWGNNELQTYTSNPSNAFHTNHNSLVIRCTIDSKRPSPEKYTSARLLSKQRLGQRRGFLTATISAPSGKGIWPAFWLLPEEPFKWPEDGEIDLFEAWNGIEECHSCLHWGGYSDPADKSKHRVIKTRIRAIEGPHDYGFAWDQAEGTGDGGNMIWYIDGRPVMRAQKPPGTRRLECWRILLNIAVGGNVCNGKIPSNGHYDMAVSNLLMSDEPPGGWQKFNQDWRTAPQGRALG